MMTSSYHRSELADEHRRDLLAQGERARVARIERTHVPARRFPVAQAVAPATPEPIDQHPCPDFAGAR